VSRDATRLEVWAESQKLATAPVFGDSHGDGPVPTGVPFDLQSVPLPADF
jgi:hypothetical protein